MLFAIVLLSTMPLDVDVHRDVDASVEDAVDTHRKSRSPGNHDAKDPNYCVDEDAGAGFGLFEAPATKRVRTSR